MESKDEEALKLMSNNFYQRINKRYKITIKQIRNTIIEILFAAYINFI